MTPSEVAKEIADKRINKSMNKPAWTELYKYWLKRLKQ